MEQTKDTLYNYANAGDQIILEGELEYGALDAPRTPNYSNVAPEYDYPRYSVTIKNPRVVKSTNDEISKNILRPSQEMTHGTFKRNDDPSSIFWSVETPRNASQAPQLFDLKTKYSAPMNQILTGPLAKGQRVQVLVNFYEYTWGSKSSVSMSFSALAIEDASNIQYYKPTTMFGEAQGENPFIKLKEEKQQATQQTGQQTSQQANYGNQQNNYQGQAAQGQANYGNQQRNYQGQAAQGQANYSNQQRNYQGQAPQGQANYGNQQRNYQGQAPQGQTNYGNQQNNYQGQPMQTNQMQRNDINDNDLPF